MHTQALVAHTLVALRSKAFDKNKRYPKHDFLSKDMDKLIRGNELRWRSLVQAFILRPNAMMLYVADTTACGPFSLSHPPLRLCLTPTE